MSRRFQGLCLEASEGHLHMPHFDAMPESVRQRLRDSRYNLCAACIWMPSEKRMLERIDTFEKALDQALIEVKQHAA